MKKLLIAAICGVLSLGASAQIIRSTSSERIVTVKESPKPVNESWNHSGFFFNTGIGIMNDYWDETVAGWEFGLGYRWHISSGFSWEVIKLGFSTGLDYFEGISARFTTGFRYDTPRIEALGKRPIYASVGLGANVLADEGIGGLAYEIGAGMKITRGFSVGLFWQGATLTDYYNTSGMFGIKAEYLF